MLVARAGAGRRLPLPLAAVAAVARRAASAAAAAPPPPDPHVDASRLPPGWAAPAGVAVHPNFLSEEEHDAWVAEVEPLLARRRYETNHWDAVIHGFRELQRPFDRLSANLLVRASLARVAAAVPPPWAPPGTAAAPARSPVPLLPFVHVLDLAADGVIGHHVDSVKFSGGLVAGLCLLTDAVMTLRPDVAGDGAGAPGGYGGGGGYGSAAATAAATGSSGGAAAAAAAWPPGADTAEVRLHLPRRCLYWVTGPARYAWGHAVLPGPQDVNGATVTKGRRLSLIFRDPLPPAEEAAAAAAAG
jgi:alkylated DNA repair protein alkB homolog 7